MTAGLTGSSAHIHINMHIGAHTQIRDLKETPYFILGKMTFIPLLKIKQRLRRPFIISIATVMKSESTIVCASLP